MPSSEFEFVQLPPISAKPRFVEPVSIEQFCVADAAEEWEMRHQINGMTLLQYKRAVLICGGDGRATLIRHTDTDFETYLEEALADHS